MSRGAYPSPRSSSARLTLGDVSRHLPVKSSAAHLGGSMRQQLGMAIRLGTWALIPSPHVVELLAKCSFDFVVMDAEHGGIGLGENLRGMIRAAEASKIEPWVRVPANETWMIGQALDAGATSVVVPNVKHPDEATKVVEACRYGQSRGACPYSRANYEKVPGFPSWEALEKRSNESSGAYVIVESQEGLQNVEKIAAVEGLTGLLLGPFDLSVDLGLKGDLSHPKIDDAVSRMVDACKVSGTQAVVNVFEPSLDANSRKIETWRKLGVTTFTASADKSLLVQSALNYTRALKG